MTLPDDLQKYCRQKILKRVIPCIILVFVFATILLLWGNIIFNTDNKAIKTVFYIVVMLIPFAITGVPFKLIDSTYYGTVKKVDVITTMDNDSAAKPTREHLYLKNTIYLRIEKPDGKLIYKKAYAGKARLQQHINTYKEGDSVFHLYGSDNVVILPKSNDTMIHCAVCGSSNKTEDDKCHYCNSSLIKII